MRKCCTRSALFIAVFALSCGNLSTSVIAAPKEAMIPAGAVVVLNLDNSNISSARFVTFPNGRDEIVSIGQSAMYWSWNSAPIVSELPHTGDPVPEGGEDRSPYYRDMLCVSRDGGRITLGGYSGFVERKLSDGTYLFSSGPMLEGISNVSYSDNGDLILLSGSGSVSLWDTAQRRKLRTLAKGTSFYDASFNNLSTRIIIASNDTYLLNLIETRTGRLLKKYEIPFRSDERAEGKGLNLPRFSIDGNFLFAAEMDQGRIHVWSSENQNELHNIDVGEFATYIVSKDNRTLIIGYKNGDVKFWRLKDFQIEKTIRTGMNPVASLSESQERKMLLVNGEKEFQLIDLIANKIVATFFTAGNHGAVYTPRGFFATDGDPHDAFKIIRGNEEIPLESFIQLNRSANLAEAAKR